MLIVFDGKERAAVKEKTLAQKVARLPKPPKLVNIVIGDDPGSLVYLRIKQQAAARVGIDYEKKVFAASANPQKIIDFIKQKNAEPSVTGLMCQQPFPKDSRCKMQETRILNAIDPKKDVDCLTAVNLGLLLMGQPRFLPATVKAIVEILKYSNTQILKKKVVVVGASNIVGKPLAIHLSDLGATVTLCRSQTKNLADYTQQADILVSATGRPGLIKAGMVKKGAAVIDVGSPQGDVDFEGVRRMAGLITPVPGGVGPLTVVCLLENVLETIHS